METRALSQGGKSKPPTRAVSPSPASKRGQVPLPAPAADFQMELQEDPSLEKGPQRCKTLNGDCRRQKIPVGEGMPVLGVGSPGLNEPGVNWEAAGGSPKVPQPAIVPGHRC